MNFSTVVHVWKSCRAIRRVDDDEFDNEADNVDGDPSIVNADLTTAVAAACSQVVAAASSVGSSNVSSDSFSWIPEQGIGPTAPSQIAIS